MGRQVTIIGSKGYIGSNLADEAADRGFEVLELERNEVPNRDLGIVFYCAGKTADFLKDPDQTIESHVGYLSKILLKSRFEKLIYLSSMRLYDFSKDSVPDTASSFNLSPDNQRHLFDLTKLTGEWLSLNHPKAVVARIANAFGGEKAGTTFLHKLLSEAKSGVKDITLQSSLDVSRYYISNKHLVDALFHISQRLDRIKIFDVSYNRPILNSEIARAFEKYDINVKFISNNNNPLIQKEIRPTNQDYFLNSELFFEEIDRNLGVKV